MTTPVIDGIPDGAGVGGQLQKLRKAGGLSLGALSERAGVHKATLSRWESGRQRPSIPELEATLFSLGAPQETRHAILNALGATGVPRALRLLRNEAQRTSPPLLLRDGMPGAGSLLRALRLRQGWSQEQLASQLKRHLSTISLWERGDAWPEADLLQRVCMLLGATPAETRALQTGHAGGAEQLPAFGEMEHQFRTTLLKASESSDLFPEMDLAFIALEASLWRHGLQLTFVRSLLPKVYTHHANYLRNVGRFAEGGTFAEKALALREGNTSHADWVDLAIICVSDAVAKGGRHPHPERGEAILYRRMAQNQLPVSYKAWLLRKISHYQFIQGRVAEAEASLLFSGELSRHTSEWHGEGVSSAEHSQVEVKRYMASQLLQSGRTEESLRWLPEATDPDPLNRLRDHLLWAEASLRLSRSSEAQAWIEWAYADIQAHNITNRRADFEKLAAQL